MSVSKELKSQNKRKETNINQLIKRKQIYHPKQKKNCLMKAKEKQIKISDQFHQYNRQKKNNLRCQTAIKFTHFLKLRSSLK